MYSRLVSLDVLVAGNIIPINRFTRYTVNTDDYTFSLEERSVQNTTMFTYIAESSYGSLSYVRYLPKDDCFYDNGYCILISTEYLPDGYDYKPRSSPSPKVCRISQPSNYNEVSSLTDSLCDFEYVAQTSIVSDSRTKFYSKFRSRLKCGQGKNSLPRVLTIT